MNLLEHFILKHLQLSGLHLDILQAPAKTEPKEAKVELNLAPRLMQADSGDVLPSYQVGARLTCQGPAAGGPAFSARVSLEAVYQQLHGDPIDLAQFTRSNASLTRQLYPLLQQEMRHVLLRAGLQHVSLPADLPPQGPEQGAERTIQVSGLVH